MVAQMEPPQIEIVRFAKLLRNTHEQNAYITRRWLDDDFVEQLSTISAPNIEMKKMKKQIEYKI